MRDAEIRYESDSMGRIEVPADAYWGAQTQRALINFDVSPLRIPVPMLTALAAIKKHGAAANRELGLIEKDVAEAVIRAADEVIAGKLRGQFPIDVFQTGSGTSWNMNLNEVLANRANEILGDKLGAKHPVHPNDHVNKGQSSNDVIPSARSIATRLEAGRLRKALDELAAALKAKAVEFSEVVKLGRTHLQDAVPITLGHEFSAFGEQIEKGAKRVAACFANLEELALGGTLAVLTGVGFRHLLHHGTSCLAWAN